MTRKFFHNYILYTLLLILFHPVSLDAQKKISLNIIKNDSSEFNIKKIHVDKTYPTNEGASMAVNNILANLHSQGYLSARIDSTFSDSLNYKAYISTGKKYYYVTLKKGNLDRYLINVINFKEHNFSGKPFKYEQIVRMSEELLQYCENNGYPFASFQLDSITIFENKVDASINFQKNNKITIDSIIIKGNSKLAKSYLKNYLGIKEGNLYDESLIVNISPKLHDLAFINEIKPSEVMFTEKNAKIFLYIDKKKVSRFYGVIGILPNNQVSGKILINGELKLTLLSAFNRGELIDLNWRSISKGTQDLKVNLAYPYLFSTPLGINYKFALYKQDTTYLTLNHNIGLQYFFRGNTYIKAYADIYSSDLLNVKGLEAITVLPDYADISSSLYGIEFLKEQYDYRLNPLKGYRINTSFAAGTKKIKKNSSINSFVYDSIQLKTSQFKISLNGSIFIPLFKKTTLLIGSDNGYIINKQIFENELFRLGGLNSLRGFDEESISASYYNTLILEIRYLFERNSFVAIFGNAAYYEKNTHNNFTHDIPYGFGAGVAFDTKIGIFTLYYALGSQFGQPIAFKQSKIHFGFANTF
ncbi:MAG: POTRA domain-containing protein [Bacteroidales bacterium]|jgi:outer membrane protein assembly factor BamA|nr:BamA/TamA family outer membrane protein [Bacteroidales bacterium]MDD4213862.1 POTRA domain-containing protein [Bacteroidales bacterium]